MRAFLVPSKYHTEGWDLIRKLEEAVNKPGAAVEVGALLEQMKEVIPSFNIPESHLK